MPCGCCCGASAKSAVETQELNAPLVEGRQPQLLQQKQQYSSTQATATIAKEPQLVDVSSRHNLCVGSETRQVQVFDSAAPANTVHRCASASDGINAGRPTLAKSSSTDSTTSLYYSPQSSPTDDSRPRLESSFDAASDVVVAVQAGYVGAGSGFLDLGTEDSDFDIGEENIGGFFTPREDYGEFKDAVEEDEVSEQDAGRGSAGSH